MNNYLHLLFNSIDTLTLDEKYLINDNYTNYYINKVKLKDTDIVLRNNIKTDSKNKKHASPFMTCWLLNIDRLISNSKINPKKYNFLDIGCGKGVSTIYVLDNYNFNSVSGFDFSQSLIKSANTNLENSIIKNKNINFFTEDASSYIIEEKTYFLYFFNPFENIILKKFLDNNIDTIKKYNSIIAYANNNTDNLILEYGVKNVINIPEYKCDIYIF